MAGIFKKENQESPYNYLNQGVKFNKRIQKQARKLNDKTFS